MRSLICWISSSSKKRFLSIQAQDFIEEMVVDAYRLEACRIFLSIQAQDFIEETINAIGLFVGALFLSIQAQDFIEEDRKPVDIATSADS